jgi:hypothetical protein
MNPTPQTPSATQADAVTRVQGVMGVTLGALIAVFCAKVLVDQLTSTGTAKADGLSVVQAGWLMLVGMVIAIGGVQMFRKGSSRPFGLVLIAMMIGFASLSWVWKMF